MCVTIWFPDIENAVLDGVASRQHHHIRSTALVHLRETQHVILKRFDRHGRQLSTRIVEDHAVLWHQRLSIQERQI